MTDTMEKVDLGDFEGRIVTKATIAVRKAGDGLSQAMKVDPVLLHQGDTVYVVLECTVGKVLFDPYDDGVCARVQNLVAGTATIIGADAVKTAIDAQRERIRLGEALSQGQHGFPTEQELHGEHVIGTHAPAPEGEGPHADCPDCRADRSEEHRLGLHNQDTIVGCPECEEESALDASEATDGA